MLVRISDLRKDLDLDAYVEQFVIEKDYILDYVWEIHML